MGGAFNGCTSLTSVTIPNSVTSIGPRAFYNCPSLLGVFFQGNAPGDGRFVFGFGFGENYQAIVYYRPGTTGWEDTFGGQPTALWLPQAQTSDARFGVRENQFGFNITWFGGSVVVVEACTDLLNPVWSPLQTITLTSDSFYFSDPQWMNHLRRFYRLRAL